MSIKDEIHKGIGAHGMWKHRITDAINTGKSEWSPPLVRQDNQCEFGKWLHACQAGDKTPVHYDKVKELHAQFHKAAADVLQLALAGKKAEAEAAIALKSEYKMASSALTSQMMAWKKSVS